MSRKITARKNSANSTMRKLSLAELIALMTLSILSQSSTRITYYKNGTSLSTKF